MSLHCIGARYVRTAPNAVLAGATTASVSLWVRLNPASGVPTAEATLLGKANADPFRVSIVAGAATTLRARWNANSSGTATGSSCDVILNAGAATHLAMVYAAGVQNYYVNGVLVQSSPCTAPLGLPSDNGAPEPFQVGPDVAGLDVSLDEPTVWQGYALTQTDITNLRDRIVHPAAVSPTKLAWGLSMVGTDGVSVAVGDAGMADIGTAGQPVTTLSTPPPAYSAGVLTYAPAVLPNVIALGPSNQTVVCRFKGSNGVAATIVSLSTNVSQAVQVTGASGTFVLTVNGQKTPPIALGSTAAVVQAAIAALSGIGAANVQVQGLSPYLITGIGALAGQPISVSIDATGVSSAYAAVPGPGTAPGSGSPATILNTDVGCVFTGTWTRTNDNPSGTSGARYVSAPPGPLAPCLATYTFSGLAPGNYAIQAAWPVSPTNATRAPYRIFDGTTLRAEALVDQTQTPGIQVWNLFSRSTIAQAYCASGTLQVVLSNDADAAVNADAVLVVPVTRTSPYLVVDDGPNQSWTNLVDSGPYFLYSQSGSDCVFTGPGWQSSGINGSDFHSSHHAAPAGTGANTVTWAGRLLAPGTYDIQATWPANMANAPNATYQVFDGTTLLGSVSVDQRPAPTGGVSDASTGYPVAFQSLGTFAIAGGTARVVLTDNASGIVVADAVLFRPTGTTPPIGTPPAQAQLVTSTTQSYGGSPSISVNGGAPITLALPFFSNDYILYPLTAPVPAGASVTLTAPTNWALTSAGSVPGFTAYPVATGLTSFLPPFNASTAKTMGVGYDIPQASYYSPCFIYADLMKQSSDWNGQGTLDVDGWPTSTTAGGVFAIVTQPPDNGIDNKGLPGAAWGAYTILWDTPDGSGNAWLSSGNGDSYAEVTSAQVLSGTSNRARLFNFTGNSNGFAAPSISVWATGNCRNIRIYPPGVPTDGSAGLFHPAYLAMLAGATNLRTEYFVQANPASVVDYADFSSTTARSYVMQYGSPTVAVASMAPAPAGQTYNFFTAGKGLMVVTTAVPHNLKTGHVVQFNMTPGTALATLAGGAVFDLAFFLPTVCVLSTTTFAVALPNPNAVVSIAYDGKGLILRHRDTSPPEHAVALANAVAGSTLHLNVPQAISDAAAATLFQMIATNLAPGRSIRVELSNEPWNYAFPYEQYAYFSYLGVQRGLNNTQAYVQRASEVQAIARTAFAAAGRPTSQIISVFNSIILNFNVATILAYAANPTDPRAGGKPIEVDEIAIAPYWRNGPAVLNPAYNFLTIDQTFDALELALPGYVGGCFNQLRQWINTAGFPSTRMISYEGGPATMYLAGDLAHLATQAQGVNLHPRMYWLGLHIWQEAQDAGCSVYTRNNVAADLTSDVGVRGGACYATYYSWDMIGGIGDGSDGLADNRPILAAMVAGTKAPNYLAMVSPLGGSINRWNALRALPAARVVPRRPATTRAAGPRPSRGRAR